jgi:cyclophilin family peptidyl-prolyl cis-trans isomerase
MIERRPKRDRSARPRGRAIVRTVGLIALVALIASGCVDRFGDSGGGAPVSSPIATTTAGGSTAPSTGSAGCPTSQPAPLPAGEKRTLTIATAKGSIVVSIEGALSPIAAGNIVALAACGYYDGVVFHRLVPGFVIQGGDGEFGRVGADGKLADPSKAGSGQLGYTIKDEPVTATYVRGVLAMARTSQPDSVDSQFFIVLDDQAAGSLASANTYQIVGHVITGMDVVDAIAAMPNSGDPDNAAIDPVPMTKVTVSP